MSKSLIKTAFHGKRTGPVVVVVMDDAPPAGGQSLRSVNQQGRSDRADSGGLHRVLGEPGVVK